MTAPAFVHLAYAEVNHGRWIARCPRPYCTNAIQLDRSAHPSFWCSGLGGCNFMCPVLWPHDPVAVEMILTMRPDPVTRNWLPNERLEDLIAENVAHGLDLPTVEGATGPVTVAMIVDDRLVGGLLEQQLISAGMRPQIGA